MFVPLKSLEPFSLVGLELLFLIGAEDAHDSRIFRFNRCPYLGEGLSPNGVEFHAVPVEDRPDCLLLCGGNMQFGTEFFANVSDDLDSARHAGRP